MHSEITSPLRIEAIDNYHPAWESVLEVVGHLGQYEQLNLDEHGWLPARQVLLAGFFQTQVAGFICFSIVPKIQSGELALLAEVEALGVCSGYSHLSVERELLDEAESRARGLKCRSVVGKAA